MKQNKRTSQIMLEQTSSIFSWIHIFVETIENCCYMYKMLHLDMIGIRCYQFYMLQTNLLYRSIIKALFFMVFIVCWMIRIKFLQFQIRIWNLSLSMETDKTKCRIVSWNYAPVTYELFNSSYSKVFENLNGAC